MQKEKEIWKDVPGYEGYYQVSDMGNFRSLDRVVVDSRGGKRFISGMTVKGVVNGGYRQVSLSMNSNQKPLKVAQIVAMAFLGHKPNGNTLVVDHINGDKSDDRVINLRIVTHRENTSTCFRSNEHSYSSKYVGVCWDKSACKWMAKVQYKRRQINLGIFNTEIEASKAYQLALSKIKGGVFNKNGCKHKPSNS